MKSKINIGLIGCGNIGSGFAEYLINKKHYDLKDINLKTIVVKDIKKKRNFNFNNITNNINKVLKDPSIDIIVELIGGYAPIDYILAAIKNKKHIITANKAIISKYGEEIFKEANKNKVNVGLEACVCAGIPIINILTEQLKANKIESIEGILNGTTNYILNRMEEGISYGSALKLAQKEGFAEPDPTFDVKGYDSQQKLAILASIAFKTKINPEDIYCEGIDKIKKHDIYFAKEHDKRIKLLGIAKKRGNKLELRVNPTLVDNAHQLASINNENNGILIKGDLCGEQSYNGKGAGVGPTVSALISDLLDISTNHKNNIVKDIGAYSENNADIIKIDYIKNRGYIWCPSIDSPGVFAKESRVMAENSINMEELKNVKQFNNGPVSPDVIIISPTENYIINNSLKDLENLDCLKGKPYFMRME